MLLNLDIVFLISTFAIIFFTFMFLVHTYEGTVCQSNNITETKSLTYYFKYTILNKLSTINYDIYNKFLLWLYVVEF